VRVGLELFSLNASQLHPLQKSDQVLQLRVAEPRGNDHRFECVNVIRQGVRRFIHLPFLAGYLVPVSPLAAG
jgi:hypothetical protein